MNTTVVILIAFSAAGVLSDNYTKVLFKDVDKLVTKIVGGSAAQRYQFPYQASLQRNNQHFCGASILTEQWLLTAAHCIVVPPSQFLVYAGILNLRENHPDVQVARVSKTVIHPHYKGGVSKSDIGLLHLSNRLNWTIAVKPISLPSEDEQSSGMAWVSGWGYTTPQNQQLPITLQQIQLQIWPFTKCANNLIGLIGSYSPLDNTMICVGGAAIGKATVCQGDSGGPLMQNGRLLGITSWTLTPCGTYRAPSVYTKVSRYLDFIRQYVPNLFK